MKSEIVPTVRVVFDSDYALIVESSPDNPDWTRFIYREKDRLDKEVISFPNEDLDNVIKALQAYRAQLNIIK